MKAVQSNLEFLKMTPRWVILSMLLTLALLIWPAPVWADGGPGGVGSDGGDSDLRLWLRADKGVYADPACSSPVSLGGTAACWSDQSGYGMDVVQTDPTLRPVYRSTKVLEFDTDVLTGTQPVQLFATPSSGLSVIVAFKSGIYTQTAVLMNYGSSAGQNVNRNLELGYTFGVDGDFGLHRGGGNATVAATTRITAEQPYIFSTVVLTGGLAPTTSVSLRLNGTPVALTTLAGGWLTSGAYPTTTVPLDIGARRDGNLSAYPNVAPDAFHKGDISEVILFTTPLNTAQRTIIENYLSAKYTIPLSAGATKYAHSAYVYDVIGIGKETDGMHSEARGAGLILRDSGYLREAGDYWMAGHRTVVNTWTSTSLPAGVSSRWERNWYFEKTDVGDNGGAVTLKFDFSEGGLEGTPGGVYVLLGRSGTSGRFRVVQASSYIAGDQVIFPNVAALKDGWSYTLGQASDQHYFLEDSQQPGGPAFNFEDISATGTVIPLTKDNEMSGALPLGFSFNFYDVNYSNVYLSTEGFITFLPGQQPSLGTPVPIPTNDVHNGLIAGWWNDLDVQYGGKFYYETRGTAPNRRFIAQYHALPLRVSGGVTSTFQIKLFESSNMIEVHYLNAQTQVNTYALAGIENQGGTSGLQYYYGDANVANIAVRYSRPPLLLEQTVNDPTPRVGDRITYTLILRSNLPAATTDAVVSDTLDAGMVFATEAITVASPRVFNQSLQGQTLRLDGFTLGAGERITFTIPVTVETDVTMGEPLYNVAFLIHPSLSAPRTSEVSIVPDNCWVNLNGVISDQIQPVIDLAASGDEVKIAGHCLDLHTHSDGLEQVAYISKTLTLRGGYTPANWTTAYSTVTTVLDARGQGRVVFIAPGVTVTLANLHLIRGDAFQSGSAQSYGGGVYAANAQLNLQDMQVYDSLALLGGGVYVSGGMLNWTRGAALTNTASTAGGGIYLAGGTTGWLDGVVVRANMLENSLSSGQGGGGVYALNSTLVLTGQVQFQANSGAYQGGAIYVQNTSLTARQITLQGNSADRGGGLFVNGGTVLMTGMEARDNYAWGRSGPGGALYLLQSSAQISTSQLISNTANGQGGAVYADRTNVWLVSSIISGNTSLMEGGGLYANSVASMTLRANDILNNRGISGAGLYINYGTPNLNNNRIVGNQASASGNGGGMVFYQTSGAVVTANLLMNNRARRGGGLYLTTDNTARLTHNQMFFNNASSEGGGLYVRSSNVYIAQNQVMTNTSGGVGGGIYCSGGTPQYIQNTVAFNSTVNGGGGIYCSTGNPQFVGNVLEFNTASMAVISYGGALGLDSTSGAQVNNNWFRANEARRGGGLYIRDSAAAVVQSNTILSNTANLGGGVYVRSGLVTAGFFTNTVAFNSVSGSDNRGAGVFIDGGASPWSANLIYSNTAQLRGGGFYINTSSAALRNNWIAFNRALNTTDSGGGVYVLAGTTVLENNQIMTNTTSGSGGGIYLNAVTAGSTLRQNTLVGNTAAKGGGIFVYRGRPVLLGNQVLRNVSTGTTDSGGGIYISSSDTQLISLVRNVVQGNQAQGQGGGLYVYSSIQDIFDGNVLLANTAQSHGGGAYLTNNTTARLLNTVVADNVSVSGMGGGIYMTGSNARWLHATIARNADAYQVGVHVQSGSPVFTNTILVSHTIGISVAQGAKVTFNATLWGNEYNASGPGNLFAYGPSVTGNPDFLAPDVGNYRIGPNSAALDAGVPAGVTGDMDGLSRPVHLGYDLGASEYRGTCFVRLNQSLYIYSTIQAAVNASTDPNDLVKVAGTCTGVHTQGARTQTVYLNKSLTLQGGYTLTQWLYPDPVAYPTTVDALNLGRVIYVADGVTTTVRGLRLRGGNAALGGGVNGGGGIYATGATLTLEGVWIFGNQAANGGGVMADAATVYGANVQLYDNTAVNGGGLYADAAALQLSGSQIFSNTATNGGGVYVYRSAAAQITHNTFHHNTATSGGGAIYLAQSPADIAANRIFANTGARGGGLYLDASHARLGNNVVVDNTATDRGSGIYVDASSPRILHLTIARNRGDGESGIHLAGSSAVVITNTVLVSQTVGLNVEAGSAVTLTATYWGNGAWANGADWIGAGSVISHLNYYAGTPAFVAPGEQDYHINGNSALINQGVLTEILDDLDGFPRDRWPDLGADEYRTCWVRLNDDPTDYTGVQAAVDAARPGDVVKIAGRCGGVSARPRNDLTTTGLVTQVVYLTQTLTLQGGYTATNFTQPYPVTQPTVLDALGVGRVVYVAGGAQPTLVGLHLTGGNAAGQGGHPTANAGGGLYAAQATVTVDACQFYDNVADVGSGIHIALGEADLRNTIIADNQTFTGGALHTWASDLHARHTTLARNAGVGVYLEQAGTAWLTNTILVSHTVGLTTTGVAAARLKATLWGNGLDWDTGNANIQAETNFWGNPAFVAPATRNYHLRGISAAIDRGVNAGLTVDGDGEMRPVGAGYDLGVDEFQGAFSLSKQAMPSLVLSGEQVTYTLSLTNTGYLPLQFTVVDHLPDHGSPHGSMTWTPWLVPGEVWTQQIPVDVELGYVGPLTNTAFATVTLGMTARAEAVARAVLQSDLAITKTATLEAAPGDYVTYTLAFQNIGASPAFSVVVSDTVPAALASLQVTATRPITAFGPISYTWNLGTLGPNSGGFITVTGRVRAGTPRGAAILNTATIAGWLIEENTSNNASGPVTTTVLNVAPLALHDVVTTAEDTPVAVPVLDNDIDLNGDALAVIAVGVPQHGQADILGVTVLYTPTQDFYGTDSFTYVVSDGVLTDTGTVSVTVLSENDPPVALDDAYSTFRNQPLSVAAPGVLANDTDTDGDALTADLVSLPVHGTTTLNADGSFVYTPTAGFAGEDAFTYQAYDGVDYSTPVTVTITVTNRAPVAAGDAYQTYRNQPLSVAAPGVLTNDSDADGDALTAALVSTPTHGTATLNADGSFVYTPTAGFVGEDAFTYQAYDGLTHSNIATVTLTIVNRAPTATGDAYPTYRNQPVSVSAPGVLLNDSDADGDALTAALATAPAHGMATLNADGSFVYTPTAGFAGVEIFTYRAYDGVDYSDAATVTVTVENRAPVAADDAYQTYRNQPLSVAATGVLANDTDADGDALTAALATAPAHGTATLNADGSFVYTPTAGFVGVDTFTYRAYDGVADSAAATVTITVENRAPVAAGDAYLATTYQPLPIFAPGVLENDADADGDSLTAALVSAPAHGTVTLNADGGFVYTPTVGNTGVVTFTYRASDGLATSNVATVLITVTANALPEAAADAYATFRNQPLSVAAPGVLANDSDAENDPLSAVFATMPAHGAVALNADGSFVYTPTTGFVGVDTFTYRAYDGIGYSDPATVTVIVTNRAPVAAGEAYPASSYQPLYVAAPGVLANDSDADGDPLSAVLMGDPAHGIVALNADGSFVYVPSVGFAGVDTFTYRAYDGLAYSNLATVLITVTANAAPVAVADAYSTFRNQPLSVAAPGVLANDSDAENDPLIAMPVSAPAYGTATLATDGSFVYTPTAGFVGVDAFTYRLYDGLNYSTPAAVTITVENRAPDAAGEAYTTFRNQPLSISAPGVLANDSDVDGDELTAALASAPAHGTATLNPDGSFVYTPTTGFAGVDAFTYRAYDGVDYSAPATVSLTVTNRAPTVTGDAYAASHDRPVNIPAPGVLANDNDADGDPLIGVLLDVPMHGTVTLNADGSFVYTPTVGFVGTDAFTYRAYDGVAYSNPATVTLTVTNDAPVAEDDAYLASTYQPLSIVAPGVLTNDRDADGDLLNTALVDGPTHGTLSLNLDGSFVYTPTLGWNGVVTFTYRASDGLATSNVATVRITVTANALPVATADAYATFRNQPLSVAAPGVLVNDTDAESDPLSAMLVSAPAHGTVMLNADGSFIYTLTTGFAGVDAFTYRAYDGIGYSDPATVTITVTNRAPVAAGDAYLASTYQPLQVAAPGVLTNDADADGDTLMAAKVSDPAHGTLVLAANGGFVYTPTLGFSGVDVFTYRAYDGLAYSEVATVVITVTANALPIAENDAYTTYRNQPLSVATPGVLGNDNDAENDPLSAMPVSAPTHGTATLKADGSFVYTPTAGFAGIDAFTYHAYDGVGYSNVATVTITVANRAPVAADDTYQTYRNQPLSVAAPGVLVNDSDADGDALTVALMDVPLYGTATLQTDGSFVYTPTAGFAGMDTFTYRAYDGVGYSNVATVTITVANRAPVAAADAYQTYRNQPISVSAPGVLANDSDADGDVLTAALATAPTHGTATLKADGRFVYTPTAGFAGMDIFTYRTYDGMSYSSPATVTITVVNRAPVAADDAYQTYRNQPLNVAAPGVLVNDSDADGDVLSAALATAPAHGMATLKADGRFVYTPTAGFAGTDAFTYRTYDGVGYSAPATVTITVANRAPVAAGDAYQTYRNQPLNVAAPGVLANDSDADGDALTAALATAPAHGTATLQADGSFVYTPTAGFAGTDTFTYRAYDGVGYSAPAAVTITVENRAPVAAGDAYPTYRNQPLSVAAPGVLANDSDADGDPLTAVLVNAPAHGTATLKADGSFVYTPTTGFVGVDTFTYRASDGVGYSALATVTITVTNRAPVAADEAYPATTYQPLAVSAPGVLLNDADPDGDALTAALVSVPGHGTVTLNPDGSFVYTPTVGFSGVDTFTYRASDGLATSNGATVIITVTANAVPVAAADAYATFRNQPLSISAPGVLANDSDAEGNPLSAVLATAPAHGTATLKADGSFVYTPTTGFVGVDTFTYRASDGVGYSAPATVTITVTNRAPTAVDDAYPATTYQPLAVSAPGVLLNDADPDGDALTAALVSVPGHGTVTLNPDGSFVYTPTVGWNGVVTFTYRASDGLATSNVATVRITVTANAVPVAAADAYATFRNQPLSISAPGVLANDSDADGDPLTAILATAPAHGTATLKADGSFVYTPTTGFVGVDTFTYRASDGVGYSAAATVTITVTNRAPVAADEAYPATTYQPLAVSAPGVLLNDADADGDALTAALVSAPAHGTLSLNLDGSFVYTPTLGWNGVVTFTYRASDGLATSNVATVRITVTANALPVATADAYATFRNLPLSVAAPGVLANDSDAESNPLSAVLASAPAHGTATLKADGSFVYTPTTGFVGVDTFTYRASDGVGYSAPATVTITVTNRAPTAVDDAYPATTYQPLAVSAPGVLLNDADPDGDALTASLVSVPAHGTATLKADGSFVYTPTVGFSGVDAFTYRASDGLATSNVATVRITVTANAVPVAAADAYATFRNLPLSVAAPGVLANDSDAESNPLSAVLASAPAHGTATLKADGSFVYTPTAGFAGVDAFTYRASDGVGYSAPATVTITVANHAPVAANDAYQTFRDQPLSVAASGVLANDADADGDMLSAALVSSPVHGMAVLATDGSFVYIPPASYVGVDVFTYRAYDGVGYSNVATVTITVVNRAPVAADDAYPTYRNQPLSVAAPGVLVNDSDADGDALTAALATTPAHGTATLQADGSLVYTPTTGFAGVDTFTYRAYDGVSYSSPATVTITVANRAPVAANDAYQTYRNQPLNVAAPGVLANDSDADGDALTAALASAPAHGTATLKADGSLVYTPTAGFAGVDAFTYRASDGVGYSAPATVTITVANHAPVAANDAYQTYRNQPLNVAAPGVLANDSDADGDALTAALATAPAHGTATLKADGSLVYTPTADFTGVDMFTYRAYDGVSYSAPATVTLTVTPTTEINYTLTISKVGEGTVDPSPGVHTYPQGTRVNLTATPANGWRFDHWSGDASGTTAQTYVIMDGNKSVTATFVQESHTIYLPLVLRAYR